MNSKQKLMQSENYQATGQNQEQNFLLTQSLQPNKNQVQQNNLIGNQQQKVEPSFDKMPDFSINEGDLTNNQYKDFDIKIATLEPQIIFKKTNSNSNEQNSKTNQQQQNIQNNQQQLPRLLEQQICKDLPNIIDQILASINITQETQRLWTQLDSIPNFIDDLRLPIKPLMPMLSQLDEYKGSLLIQTLIKDCNKKIPLFRHIRGDGNCFFRAFAFLYLETILNQEQSLERLMSLINELWKDADILDSCTQESLMVLESEEVKNFRLNRTVLLEVFKLFYNEIRQNKLTKAERSAKLVNLFNKEQKFDVGVIMLFRKLALRAKQFYLQGVPTNDEEKQFQTELQNVEYILDEIQMYGQESEEPIIIILARYLYSQVEVNYLDNKHSRNTFKEPQIVVVKMPDAIEKCRNINGFSFRPVLQLYFRKGHYDVGYLQNYVEEVYNKSNDLQIKSNLNELKSQFMDNEVTTQQQYDEKLTQNNQIGKPIENLQNEIIPEQILPFELDQSNAVFDNKQAFPFELDEECDIESQKKQLEMYSFEKKQSEKNEAEQKQGKQQCQVCKIYYHHVFIVEECKHNVCQDCLNGAFEIQKSTNQRSAGCPANHCNSKLYQKTIDSYFNKFNQFQQQLNPDNDQKSINSSDKLEPDTYIQQHQQQNYPKNNQNSLNQLHKQEQLEPATFIEQQNYPKKINSSEKLGQQNSNNELLEQQKIILQAQAQQAKKEASEYLNKLKIQKTQQIQDHQINTQSEKQSQPQMNQKQVYQDRLPQIMYDNQKYRDQEQQNKQINNQKSQQSCQQCNRIQSIFGKIMQYLPCKHLICLECHQVNMVQYPHSRKCFCGERVLNNRQLSIQDLMNTNKMEYLDQQYDEQYLQYANSVYKNTRSQTQKNKIQSQTQHQNYQQQKQCPNQKYCRSPQLNFSAVNDSYKCFRCFFKSCSRHLNLKQLCDCICRFNNTCEYQTVYCEKLNAHQCPKPNHSYKQQFQNCEQCGKDYLEQNSQKQQCQCFRCKLCKRIRQSSKKSNSLINNNHGKIIKNKNEICRQCKGMDRKHQYQ